MGGSSSTPKIEPLLEHHQPYPDMNVIFKGIPKMIQVHSDFFYCINDIDNLSFTKILELFSRTISRNNFFFLLKYE